MTKRHIAFLPLLVLALAIFAAAGGRHHYGGHSVNVSTHNKGAWDDCRARYTIDFEDRDTFTAQQTQTLARSSFSTLSLHGMERGGISVHGWDKPDVAIVLCKAVSAGSQAEADKMLGQIELKISGGDVTVTGPGNDDEWWTGLLVQVPSNIAMDVETRNGPIDFQEVKGTLDARAHNGPIALKHCSGRITVETQNGPIEAEDLSGKVNLDAQNGPLDITLSADRWQGEGMEAHTQNGPLELKLPSGYKSGVEIRASEHSPFSCRASVCNEGAKDWDNHSRSIRFGPTGATLVRLSTVNGPVDVHTARYKNGDED